MSRIQGADVSTNNFQNATSTDFYNRYLLDRTIAPYDTQNVLQTGVLKKDYTLNYSDFEKLKITEQYNKLYADTFLENQKNAEIKENQKIYNLSLNQLFKNASRVYMQLINDLTIYFNSDKKNINQLGVIFSNGETLLYVGLLVMILSFFLLLIDVGS